jgi:hypothetical protein
VSAAAAAAAQKRLEQSHNRRKPIPDDIAEELTRQIELPQKNFAKVPMKMFLALLRKFITDFEVRIGIILVERSYGGNPRSDGEWDHPEWVQLTAEDIAVAIGNVSEEGIARKEGIEKRLKAMEARKTIQSLKVGRLKYYRLCLESFEEVPDREIRTVERKPPELAEEFHSADEADSDGGETQIVEVAPSEPLIIMVGDKSRPYVFGTLRGVVRAGPLLTAPVSLIPSKNDYGGLDWLVDGWSEKQANTNNSTRVRSFANVNENKGQIKSNGHKKRSAAEEIERAECGVMRDFLKRWFGRELGDPSDAIVKQAIEALGGAPASEFAARIKKRAPELEYLSWKIVVGLAADVGREFVKRKARSARPEIPEPALTPQQQAELDEFYKRQRERFGK